jgi:hypothetical protein
MIKKYNITLISFYTEEWKNAYRRFYKHAKDLNIFSNFCILNSVELEKETNFETINKLLINNNPTGFGLFLWKSYIIEYAFNKFPESDYFFYLDIGTEFNINKKTINRLYEYVEDANKNSIFAFRNRDLEENLTHCTVIDNVYPNARNSKQFNAGALILKNNDTSLNIIKEWKKECVKDNYYNLLDNKIDKCCSSWDGDHLHDQSVLSCILKKHGIDGIIDEADWYIPGESTSKSISKNRNQYPLFFARNPFLKSILYKECINYKQFTTCKHGNNCPNVLTVRK